MSDRELWRGAQQSSVINGVQRNPRVPPQVTLALLPERPDQYIGLASSRKGHERNRDQENGRRARMIEVLFEASGCAAISLVILQRSPTGCLAERRKEKYFARSTARLWKAASQETAPFESQSRF